MGTSGSHVVNVNWNDGNWNVDDWDRDDIRWSGGKRVFSPENERFLPALLSGSFLLQSLPPTADLPTYFLDTFRKKSVFFIIQNVQLPGYPKQKLEHIDAHYSPVKRRQLLFFSLIRRDRNQFEYVQKPRIYPVAQGISGLFRKMVAITIPSLVYCESMLNNRKQIIHTYHDIISIENLLAAWQEFAPGKRKKADVLDFQAHLMDNIISLHEDLKQGVYRHGEYVAFKIADPKPRDIHKAIVRDRVLHHAIYRKLYPFFDRTWVADSYSCRNDKGTHRAMNRFKAFNNKVSKNNTKTCWVLKCDIKKFFASVDQKTMIKILKKYIPDWQIVGLIREIVESFQSGRQGIGLPLGNLTSQLLVNIYMNEFDQYVKHKLKCRYYIRYADDFVLMSQARNELERYLPLIKEFLNTRLKLDLHPDKCYIKTFASGVDFLGWIHFNNHRIFRAASKRRMLRNLAEERSEPRLISYRGLLSHGNAHKLSTQYLQDEPK